MRNGWLHLFGTGIALLRFDIAIDEAALTVHRLKACLYELSRDVVDLKGRLHFRAAEQVSDPLSLDTLLTVLTAGLAGRAGTEAPVPLLRSEQHRSFTRCRPINARERRSRPCFNCTEPLPLGICLHGQARLQSTRTLWRGGTRCVKDE